MDFLQSKQWAEFQRSLGREVFEYDKEGISAKIIKHNLPFRKNYLYIPHGPAVDFNSMTAGFKNPVNNFVKHLRDLGRQQKSIFIKAEPLADSIAQALTEAGLPGQGFKKSKKEIQPARSVVINLGDEDLEILGRMHHKTRYNIKVAERNSVVVHESHNIDSFLKLLKKTAKRDKFNPHPADYYQKLLSSPFLNSDAIQTKLFLAEYNEKPVAGAIVLVYGDTGYYLHGASDYKYRAVMASYILHWEIIEFLKRHGVRNYDMWGINSHKWPGVTRFKLGWGGRLIEHPGSFDLTISWFWHSVYKLFSRK